MKIKIKKKHTGIQYAGIKPTGMCHKRTYSPRECPSMNTVPKRNTVKLHKLDKHSQQAGKNVLFRVYLRSAQKPSR